MGTSETITRNSVGMLIPQKAKRKNVLLSSEDRKFSHFKEGSQLGLLFILARLQLAFPLSKGELSLEQHRLQRLGLGGQCWVGTTKSQGPERSRVVRRTRVRDWRRLPLNFELWRKPATK